MPDRPETDEDRCATCARGVCPSEVYTECHSGVMDHYVPLVISYSERRLPDGTRAAIGVIPSGRPADAQSVPPPRTESHGDEAGATSGPPEASGAPGRVPVPYVGFDQGLDADAADAGVEALTPEEIAEAEGHGASRMRVRRALAVQRAEETRAVANAVMHPTGRCTCAGEGTCLWCKEAARREAEPFGRDPVPVEVRERGWQWHPVGEDGAFAPPFGTIRVCIGCGCLVAGGPTRCVRCANDADVDRDVKPDNMPTNGNLGVDTDGDDPREANWVPVACSRCLYGYTVAGVEHCANPRGMSQDFSCFAPTTSALMDRTEAPAPEDHGAELLEALDTEIAAAASPLVNRAATLDLLRPARRHAEALIADLDEMREARDEVRAQRERARGEQRSLAAMYQTERAAREKSEAEVAALTGLLADRDGDLLFEYERAEKAEALADTLGAEMEAIWQDYRTAELGRWLAEDGCGQNHDRAEKAEAQLAALTLEVARLQAGASAVHASTVQARRAMTDVEERAEQAAMPWKRKTYSPEVAAMIRAAVRGDGLEKTR